MVEPGDLAALDQRTEARARLDELAAAGGEWTPPLVVRQSMSFWEFDRALDQMATSHACWQPGTSSKRSSTRSASRCRQGSRRPTSRRRSWRTLTALTAELLELGEDLVDADAVVRGSHDPLTRIGLLGSDAEARLDDALVAFNEADPDATGDAIDDATATVAARIRASCGSAACSPLSSWSPARCY